MIVRGLELSSLAVEGISWVVEWVREEGERGEGLGGREREEEKEGGRRGEYERKKGEGTRRKCNIPIRSSSLPFAEGTTI